MPQPDSEFFRQGWQFRNRVHLGQISSVNEAKGTISVVLLDGNPVTRKDLEIPWGGFSMNGHQSSWVRYMPQVATSTSSDNLGGDLVYVMFGPRDDARVIGFATNEGTYDSFFSQRNKDKTVIPYGDFVQLRQGEWDMRSSGGAYLYGNRDGALLLAAGPTVQARLDKQNNEGRLEAGLWRMGGAGSFYRVGDIKRQLPGTFKETVIPGSLKESWLHLEVPGLPGAALLLLDHKQGDVRDALGIPIPGPVGAPLASQRKYWVLGQPTITPVPIATYSEELDTLGNKSTVFGPSATVAEVVAPTVSANISLANLALEVSGTAAITAGGSVSLSAGGALALESTGPASLISAAATVIDAATTIGLGTPGAAIHPAVRGEALAALLAALSTTCAASFTTLAALEGGPVSPKGAALTAVATAFTTLAAGLAATLSEKVLVE